MFIKFISLTFSKTARKTQTNIFFLSYMYCTVCPLLKGIQNGRLRKGRMGIKRKKKSDVMSEDLTKVILVIKTAFKTPTPKISGQVIITSQS